MRSKEVKNINALGWCSWQVMNASCHTGPILPTAPTVPAAATKDKKSSAVAEMGDRGHNRHGPQRGAGCCAPFAGAGTPSSTMWPGPHCPPLYQAAYSSIQPFGHNRRGPKIGWGSAPFGVGAGSPSNTKSPGLRPTSIPSDILMHPAVWPQ